MFPSQERTKNGIKTFHFSLAIHLGAVRFDLEQMLVATTMLKHL